MSNIVYGLGLMGAEWADLEDELREVIQFSLSLPLVFAKDVSQHVANTLWGLAKMVRACIGCISCIGCKSSRHPLLSSLALLIFSSLSCIYRTPLGLTWLLLYLSRLCIAYS